MSIWSRIVDVFVDKQNAPPGSPTKVIGAGGTAIFGGFIVEGEKNTELTGRRKHIKYATMVANTTIIAGSQRYYLNYLAKPDWRPVPPEEFIDDPQAVEFAEFIEHAMHDMTTPWDQVVTRIAMFKYHGYSWSEWTAKLRADGKIGMADIEPRPQSTIERWLVDDKGEVLGVVQRDPSTGKELELPRWKAVYAVDDTLSDSPEGLGLYRQVVKAADELAELTRLEAIGFEIDLRGIPIGRAPLSRMRAQIGEKDFTQADYDEAVAVIDGFVQNHIRSAKLGLVLDSEPFFGEKDGGETPTQLRQWDVELMKGGPTLAEAVAKAISRKNHEIARVMQTQHLLLGQDRGTQSLSVDMSGNFRTLIESGLRGLSRVLRRDFTLPLARLNGVPEEKAPHFETDPVAFREVEELSGVLEQLTKAGIGVPADYEGINVVLRQAGLPPVDLEQAALDAATDRANIAEALRGKPQPGDPPTQPGGNGPEPPPPEDE